MNRDRALLAAGDARLRWDNRPSVALMMGVACLAVASAVSAAETAAGPVLPSQFPLGQVFTILFLMLGPFKVIGPFFKVTKGADAQSIRRIAMWATLFSAVALLIAGLLGEFFLSRYSIPLPVLSLAGGVIFFLVALKSVLEQFEPPEPPAEEVAVAPESVMKVALAPLAFPAIVTPYGIAALVVLVALSQSLESRLTIAALVVTIMVLNLLVMLVAWRLQTALSFVLRIFGAVLGVIQVALGLQIMNSALRALGVL